MTTDTLIKVKGLKKSFGNHEVLKGIDYEIHKGDKIVVIGPSGSGKSTFLRCLNLLETPTEGEIWFDDKLITDKKTDINEVRKHMGMVFQHFNLFNNLTIQKNITLAPVKLKLMSKEEANENALRLLKMVGLEDKADAYPSSLSGGQKQRLCIARAMIKNPKILILDDSTSAVDTATEAKIRESFYSDLKETTIFIIAQRISSVQEADKILVIDDGQIKGIGTHEELMESNEIYQEICNTQKKGVLE